MMKNDPVEEGEFLRRLRYQQKVAQIDNQLKLLAEFTSWVKANTLEGDVHETRKHPEGDVEVNLSLLERVKSKEVNLPEGFALKL
jgi:hypothetical protein